LKSNKQYIQNFYMSLIKLDSAIKSWKVPDTYFWLGIKNMIYEQK
jgi:hypothetical protein